MAGDAPLLDVRDLCVSFRSGGRDVPIIENVSFTVCEREILGIVGESGSGKSVTAMAIMRLIDDPGVSLRGSVRFRGQELTTLPQKAFRHIRGREIAMIFQDPMTAFTPVYTIGWQIDEAIRVHERVSKSEARARTVRLLGDMGVPDPERTANRYPHQLSGGLRQRAMIAMALSCNPALLIADEPTTALDVTVQAQILDLLRNLRTDYGSAVMLITHDMGVVAETCDHVMVLYSGRVAERGPASAVFEQPAHPYTAALLDSIPPLTGPRPVRLPSIAGAPPAPLERPSGCAFAPRCHYAHDACVTLPPLVRFAEQDVACVLPTEGKALPTRLLHGAEA
ncbi:oligopeptide transporter ATP-binding protein OppD [Acetobacter aceti NRIC 0242]|uniref:ABC transporter ATP-binding protein n=1 Tax=Acetobacter aceti NBRC 14818 TaxID=887700 RepID=A0AB33I728_ACEAC|nr:ABC transporter ATP-binding protein [Acetobacter aceti]TCS34947.1 peptide/nickel transport system ATP-binding protein [Acetobacter aceti NBRC 14818]BCK74473.1 ABC transporter ATP-binding protein [Acetobacter aceti NBRC 14818]GAN55982.1 ABC transporter oligopeptide permease OppD [Acetobacter aceti NBRC 14818]GBO80178.1 oligopeptide transporter ATP-binding protein OppD [Acetobacter aceti NRIC 0242]